MWIKSKLVLASSNAGKLKEFANLFRNLDVKVVSQRALGIVSPEEIGETFIENALLKARFASKASGLPALGDDSGLVVPALKGEPGLYSSRYAGLDATDENNLKKLLHNMKNLKGIDRKCYYITVLALVRYSSDVDPIITTGRWKGLILTAPKGNRGFGYDPVFLPDGQHKTAAEMTDNNKNDISHRGQAFRELLKSIG